MSIVLRNSLDIYKLITIVVILFVWMIHWLASKRTKGLIGEESKSVFNHARLLLLYVFLCLFDGAITYVFTQQFFKYGNKINDIYVIAGFEVSSILNIYNYFSLQDFSARLSKTTSNTKFHLLNYTSKNNGLRKNSHLIA